MASRTYPTFSATALSLLSTLGTSLCAITVFAAGCFLEELEAKRVVTEQFKSEETVYSQHVALLQSATIRNDHYFAFFRDSSGSRSSTDLRNILLTQFITAPLASVDKLESAEKIASEHYLIQIGRQVKELKNLIAVRIAADATLSEQAHRLKKIAYGHSLVALDATNLLSLHSNYAKFKEMNELFAYKSGILKYFPILENLPDGIIDLSDLRDRLKDAGGKVKLQLDSTELAPQQFAEQLQSLRVISEKIVLDYERLELEFASTQQRREEIMGKIRVTQNRIREESKEVFLFPHSNRRTQLVIPHIS